MNKPEYCRKIESLIYYLKIGAAFKTTIAYSNKADFLRDLKKYIKNDLTDENKVYIDILYKMAISKKGEDLCIFYYNNDPLFAKYKYIELISEVLNTYKNNKEEAITIAVKSFDKYTKYPDALKKFNNKFYNAILYRDILNEVLEEAIKRYKEPEEKRNSYLNLDALRHSNDDIYQEVYDSGLSLLDYAHTYFVDSTAHQRFFSPRIAGCDKDLVDEILSRKDTCLNELFNVISKIDTGEIADAIDYYELTMLNPLYLKKLANEYNLLSIPVRKFISKNINPHSEKTMVEGQIKEKMIINNTEVSREIKVLARDKMIEMGMPLSAAYHKQFIRKLLKSK